MTSPMQIIHKVSYFSDYLCEIEKEFKTVLTCLLGTQMELFKKNGVKNLVTLSL